MCQTVFGSLVCTRSVQRNSSAVWLVLVLWLATVELRIPWLHVGEIKAGPSLILFIYLAFDNISTFTFVFPDAWKLYGLGISDFPVLSFSLCRQWEWVQADSVGWAGFLLTLNTAKFPEPRTILYRLPNVIEFRKRAEVPKLSRNICNISWVLKEGGSPVNLAKVPKIAFALNSLKPGCSERQKKFNLCQTVSHPLLPDSWLHVNGNPFQLVLKHSADSEQLEPGQAGSLAPCRLASSTDTPGWSGNSKGSPSMKRGTACQDVSSLQPAGLSQVPGEVSVSAGHPWGPLSVQMLGYRAHREDVSKEHSLTTQPGDAAVVWLHVCS